MRIKKIVTLLSILGIITNLFSYSSFASTLEGELNTGDINGNSGIQGCVLPSSSTLLFPNSLVAEPVSTTSIKVSWELNTTTEFQKYELWRADDENFASNAMKMYEGTNKYYTVNNLNPGKTYYFKTRAIYNYTSCNNTILNSSFSPVSNGTTMSEPIILDNITGSGAQTTAFVNSGFLLNTSSSGFTSGTGNMLFDDSNASSGTIQDFSGIVIGDIPVDLPNTTGELDISVILKSLNIIKDTLNNEYSAEAFIPAGTEFKNSDGTAYTGVIYSPNLIGTSEASELDSAFKVISVIEIGSENTYVSLSGAIVTILIPAPGYNIGDSLIIKSSNDGVTWTNHGTYTVILVEGKPYIKFTTDHFTMFAVVKTLPTCTDSDFTIGSWSSCNGTTQTRTVTKNATSSCNSTIYTPSTSQTCSSGTSGSSGGGGGGGGGGSFLSYTCTDSKLECKDGKWILKTGNSCSGGNLGKTCNPSSIGSGTTTTTTGNVGNGTNSGNILENDESNDLNNLDDLDDLNNLDDLNDLNELDSEFETNDDGSVIITKEDGTTITFSDINDTFAKKYIAKLASLGIVAGYEDGTFKPDKPTSRAEYLKMVLLANNIDYSEVETSTLKFKDIEDKNSWIARVVAKALELNMIDSNNLYFRPNDYISRQESMKMLITASGFEINEDVVSEFEDVSGWATKYIMKAKELGIVDGQEINGKLMFRPKDNITRAEVAKIVVKVIELK